MYLSIMEEYFSVNVTHNLRIGLTSNIPPKSFSVDFIHFSVFSSVFKHRTDCCSDYDINAIYSVRLPLFHVE